MLISIKSVKGLGVFSDFKAKADQPALERFNLIYGDNGSGKTTFARLLHALNDGGHPEYPSLEYNITTDVGVLAHGQKSARAVRVFNSDYIDANMGTLDGPLRHILIVGEENKALAEEIKVEQASHQARSAKHQALAQALAKLERDRGKIFTTVASTIGEATSGSVQRSYRKPDAEKAFENLKNFALLTEDDLKVHRGTIRQDLAAEILTVQIPEIEIGEAEPASATHLISELVSRANLLTQRSAQAGALKRLAENPDIAGWVEEGRKLHHAHSSSRCEFCDQVIPMERLERLAEHFSAEDQALKFDVEAAIIVADEIIAAVERVTLPGRVEFYAELREKFDAASEAVGTRKTELLEALKKVSLALTRKLLARATAYDDGLAVDTTAFEGALNELAALIGQHNGKTAAFDAAQTAARSSLQAHYLSTIADQVKEFDVQIAATQKEIVRLLDGAVDLDNGLSLAALAISIAEKKGKVSNAHAGGDKMTKHLASFLGRTDLTFESDDEGYRVKRRGKPAKRLSEGEKTAIAFLYFIVQLRDQDFDLEEGIVVIDDPISSLDSSAIYQAFAYLKSAVKDAKQVFLLTHNFDFLKLLINWLDNVPGVKRRYYMLVCAETENERVTRIEVLDPLLVKHPTEYHYLFKLLYTFKGDGTIQSAYHIPNIARKVLETFLEFHVPSNDKLHTKLAAIDFDEVKKTAINKFANDLSHMTGKGFDPAIVSETQKNVTHLLDMIKAVAPMHYDGLEKLAKI